jgi:hypothetical protein
MLSQCAAWGCASVQHMLVWIRWMLLRSIVYIRHCIYLTLYTPLSYVNRTGFRKARDFMYFIFQFDIIRLMMTPQLGRN